MNIRGIAAIAALAILACQEDRHSPAGLQTEIRDSAGIHIVENARPADGLRLAWQVGPRPAVSMEAA